MTSSEQFPPSSQPQVSVVIPAYNAAPYIIQTLESVFAQSFRDFEVIVINDGSPDTEEFERLLQPYINRIVYLKQENRGPSAARNRGIRRANGKYLAFLDSDDIWLAEYLSEYMRVFSTTPSPDLLYSHPLQYYSSMTDGVPFSPASAEGRVATFESLLTGKCEISTSTVIVRKQVVLDAGLFDERLWRSEDYDLWLRIAHRGARISHQQRVLVAKRIRLDSLTSQNIKMLEGIVQVLNKLGTTLKVTPTTRDLLRGVETKTQANLDLERAKVYLQRGRFEQAHDALRSANIYFHRRKLTLMLLMMRLSPQLAWSAARLWGTLAVLLWRLKNPERRSWPVEWVARNYESSD